MLKNTLSKEGLQTNWNYKCLMPVAAVLFVIVSDV